MTKFTAESISIGDEVYFESPHIKNFELYWTVINKDGNSLQLEIKAMGVNDRRWIDLQYIEKVIITKKECDSGKLKNEFRQVD